MGLLRVILCGYHWTGCRVLEHLVGRGDVGEVAVYTHEGPGHIPDVREVAARLGVRCSTEDVSRAELPFEPDIVASVYYRNIIRRNVIEACRGRIFNVHPSLLPRHRGCSSIPWAIIEGDAMTGVTLHYVDEGIDTGNVILQRVIGIGEGETAAELFERCMRLGVEAWPEAFELVKGGYGGVKQEGAGTYHKRGAPHGGEIDGSWDLGKVERFIRAMTFPPYAYARYKGREVRTLEEYERMRGDQAAAVC